MVLNSWYEAPRDVSPKSSLFSMVLLSCSTEEYLDSCSNLWSNLAHEYWQTLNFAHNLKGTCFGWQLYPKQLRKWFLSIKKSLQKKKKNIDPHVSQITFNLDTEHPVFPYFSWLDTYCLLKVPNIAKIIDYTAKQGMLRSNFYPLEIVFFLNDICASVTNLIAVK